MPTSDLQGRLASLSPAQRAVLERELLRLDDASPAGPALRRRDESGPCPLSHAQERLWFIAQLRTDSAMYNVPRALRIRGWLDVDALARSLTALVARHETLRTGFIDIAGEPRQVVGDPRPLPLPIRDLSGVPGSEREAVLARLLREEGRRPFDLERDLMLRACLFRLGADEWVLLLTTHHIASDGWSASILFRELGSLYAASSTPGGTAGLPDVPLRYIDYALWQREWLQGERLEREIAHWRTRLAGVPPLLALPTDRPRPSVESHTGACRTELVPGDLARALTALARQERVTLFMLLLAAFQTLLARFSGETDIVVGSPIAGRSHVQTEGLVGFFVNTLAIRTDLGGAPTFRALLGRVRETTLEAFTHQELPFGRLIAALGPERTLSHAPLFQVAFVLQNAPGGMPGLPGLCTSAERVDLGTAQFDLTLEVEPVPDGLRATFEYSTDLFEAATVERMARHFLTLLRGTVEKPDARITELPLLSAEEQRQRLVEWNDTAAPFPRDACIHRLFEAQATRTPEATALVDARGPLAYRDLDAASTRLARRLRALGVGPDRLVAVCLERSAQLVTALLAVLKAGGAYVPLDLAYPPERLRFTVEDARPVVLVTRRTLLERFPAVACPTLCVDDDGPTTVVEAPGPLDGGVAATHLAYVIYTSGSTGRPKGVMVPHRAVVNHLAWMQQTFPLGPGDTVLQKTPVGFDVSVWEMWGPLLAGARLALVPPSDDRDPAALVRALVGHRVTLLQTVPSQLSTLLEEPGLPACRSLRHILCGGEPMPADLPRRVHACLDVTLHNLYGPTETTIDATWWSCPPARAERVIPIGRPIANVRALVLDDHGQLVPVGVAGELYLGGAGLARGYWNRPDLTAERFVPDPFGLAEDGRLYRTGDLVRYRADGAIEFQGRVDRQVKLRGHRVELGEVEGVLREHSSVREAVALLREDRAGDSRLVAYVVPAAAAGLDAAALRSFAQTLLPDYMVPAVIVLLDVLPLTPNGKVDLAALPVPDASGAAGLAAAVAPRTPVEDTLAAIWAGVLGRESLGVHDDFFALGGHSLLAVRVMSRMRTTLGVDLPVRCLFETPTVAALAAAVEAARGAATHSPAAPVPRVTGNGPFPLSPSQEQFWLLARLDPDNPAYHGPVAFRVSGNLRLDALRRALDTLVERHEPLRTNVLVINGRPVQVVAPPRPVEVPVVDLRERPPTEQAEARDAYLHAETRRPFDLGSDLMLRAAVIRLGEGEHVLLINTHHIAGDGWSNAVLLRELEALYAGFAAGRPSPLPPLPLRYADFAVWQRGQITGGALDRQLAYWRRRLAGAPLALDLPTDRPRRADRSRPSARRTATLSPVAAAGLGDLGRREESSLFMVLLAACAALLGRYTGAEDLVIGAPFAGRRRLELEPLIGCFLNTIALRIDASGNPSFRELVRRVRGVVLEAHEHHEAPFADVVAAVNPERRPGHTPLFQVMFNTPSLPGGRTLDLPGLAVTTLPRPELGALFDLTFSYSEQPDRSLELAAEFDAALFEPVTIERLLAHCKTLIEAAVADADRRLSDLPVLTEAERQQLLGPGSHTPAERPTDTDLASLFETRAARTPDAVAVVDGGRVVTWHQLDGDANRLAHHLRGLGVGPDVPVAVCLDRSLEFVMAALGILKAGGAYVPLDPAAPRERLLFMLEDVGAVALVTDSAHASPFVGSAIPLVRLDADGAGLAAKPETSPGRAVTGDHLAYVMYTSGSTGRPKPVAIPQRAVAHLVLAPDYVDLGPADVVAHASSVAFDAATFEVWGSLLNGARLVVLPTEVVVSPAALAEALKQHRVTTLFLTTALFNEVARLAPTAFARLRHLLFGGEAVDPRWVRHACEHGRPARLLHVYGPTETTTFATWHLVDTVGPDATAVPIGRPLGNTEAYVLDRHLALVPAGVVGELFLGGPGLARGYLGRPELTAERFVPHPFRDEPGARLYRTGDLVRWRPAGELEFVGRTDDQLKIRGHRIEPGEIEAALEHEPGVGQAFVMARTAANGERQLAAYVVPAGAAPSPARLRAALRRRLPEYMIPASVTMLKDLPLTANGKVDREALPLPGMGEETPERVAARPRDPLVLHLAKIWEDVLGVHPIAATDSFLDLGGHSLLAVHLIERIRAAFGRQLPLDSLWNRGATVEQVARLLRDDAASAGWPRLVEIQPAGRRPPLFCVHTLGGNLFHYYSLAGHLSSDQPLIGLQARGVYGHERPQARVADIAADGIQTMRAHQPLGPYRLLGYSSGGVVVLEMAQQLRAAGQEVALLALLDTFAPGVRLKRRFRRAPGLGVLKESLYFRILTALGLGHRRRFRRAGEAHRWAHRSYRAKPYPGRVDLFLAEQSLVEATEPYLGWPRLAGDGLVVHQMPGAHHGLVKPPIVQRVAALLQQLLDDSGAAGQDHRAMEADTVRAEPPGTLTAP